MENNFEGKIEQESKENKIRRLRDELYDRNTDLFHELIVEKANDLRSKRSDCEDYFFYHILIGSTPQHKLDKLDFEGENSIELFLEKQIQELPPESK